MTNEVMLEAVKQWIRWSTENKLPAWYVLAMIREKTSGFKLCNPE